MALPTSSPRTIGVFSGMAIGALGLLLTACAPGNFNTTTNIHRSGQYSPRLVNAAARYDAVKLEVAGNPFGGSHAAFAETVHAGVTGTSAAHQIPFTLGEPDPRSAYRMVVLANPPRQLDHHAVCRGERRSGASDGGRLELMMTYCLGEETVSSLRTRRADVAGADDPALRDMVRQATLTMFPPVDETRHDGDSGDFE